MTNDTFNNNDQLTSETGTVNNVSSWSTSFQYDPNGSLTNVTRTGSSAETDAYVYDLQHRLSSATISRTEQGQSVAITASYLYDDSGYRAQGTVTINNGTPTVTNYLTDTMNPTGYSQVLEEHIGNSSTPSMSYIVGLAIVGQTNASTATSYLMPDAQGSTRQLTDSSGNITARFSFDAWGVYLYAPIGVLSAPATKILYTGQLFDVVLLMENLRFRYLQPTIGRFTGPDSFAGYTSVPLTLNRYLYCLDNPLNRIDPSGHWSLTEIMVVLAIGLTISAIHLAPILGLSLIAGRAPDVVGFGFFGSIKVGPIEPFGGVEFDLCPRSGQSNFTVYGGLAGAIKPGEFSIKPDMEKFFSPGGREPAEGGFYEVWYWNVPNLNGNVWHPYGWAGLQVGGIWGGMLGPYPPDGSVGWLWGVAYGKNSKDLQGFGVIEGDLPFLTFGPWDTPKGEMTSLASLGEAAMSAAELYRNSEFPAGNISKLISIFVNGGLAAAWVNATYKK